jgi:hypothetical protein
VGRDRAQASCHADPQQRNGANDEHEDENRESGQAPRATAAIGATSTATAGRQSDGSLAAGSSALMPPAVTNQAPTRQQWPEAGRADD